MKEDIRKRLIEKRKKLSEKELLEKSKQIKKRLFEMSEFQKASNILFYVSYDNAVYTHEMIKDVVYSEDRGAVEVKGFKSPIKVYAAIDFRKNLGKKQNFMNVSTNGFSLVLDGEKVANYDRTKVLSALRSAIEYMNKNSSM